MLISWRTDVLKLKLYSPGVFFSSHCYSKYFNFVEPGLILVYFELDQHIKKIRKNIQ